MGRLRNVENSRTGVAGTKVSGNLLQQHLNGMGANIYDIDTTAKWDIGTRLVTGDGRVFRYAKSGGACYTGQGNAFYQDKAFADTTTGALAATDTKITFLYADSGTFTLNELKGGYITIFGGTPTNADCPFRYIIGNNANGTDPLTLELDGPVGRVVTTAQFCEVYYNPYADIRHVTGDLANPSFAGLAAAYVSAASKYFWCQTWGPCWIAPQVASFSSGAYRDAYFKYDGTIVPYSADQSDADSLNKQRAGFIMPPGLTAGPLLMLQIAP